MHDVLISCCALTVAVAPLPGGRLPSYDLCLFCHCQWVRWTPHYPCQGSEEEAGESGAGLHGREGPLSGAGAEGFPCWDLADAADSAMQPLVPAFRIRVSWPLFITYSLQAVMEGVLNDRQ